LEKIIVYEKLEKIKDLLAQKQYREMTTARSLQRYVRLAYQPLVGSTFLSEQTSHQQPASSTFLSQQTSTSHQPPASSTFISEQISHQQPTSSTFLSQQTSISHQPPAKRTGCKLLTWKTRGYISILYYWPVVVKLVCLLAPRTFNQRLKGALYAILFSSFLFFSK
jgi:hypothetical protein